MNGRNLYSEILIYLTYMVFGLSWAIAGGMMPSIMKDLNLTVADGSFLTTSITIAKIIGALGAGWLLNKVGIKKCFDIGSLMIAISILCGISHDYTTLLLIRFIMGLGGAICLVCLVPAIQILFDTNKRGLVNGINATSNVVGAIIALGVSYIMEAHYGWRETLSLWGAVSVILFILWALNPIEILDLMKPEVENKAEKVRFSDVIRSKLLWAMIIFYIFTINYLNVSFTYMPLYYQKYMHFAPGSLGSFSPMIINVGMFIGPFIGIYLAKLLGRKGTLIFAVVFSTITGLLSISMNNENLIVIMSLLSGICVGCIFPVFFNLPSYIKNSSPAKTGYTMSIFWCVTYVLSTINTWFMGHLVDTTHSFNASFVYMFSLSALAYIGIYLFPVKNKD